MIVYNITIMIDIYEHRFHHQVCMLTAHFPPILSFCNAYIIKNLIFVIFLYTQGSNFQRHRFVYD